MPTFKFKTTQVIHHDFDKGYITDKSIKTEYIIEAPSSNEEFEPGYKKLYEAYPKIPANNFLTGIS